MADRNSETRELRRRMTQLIGRSTLGSADALRARRTTSIEVRNGIVKASGTVRDSRR